MLNTAVKVIIINIYMISLISGLEAFIILLAFNLLIFKILISLTFRFKKKDPLKPNNIAPLNHSKCHKTVSSKPDLKNAHLEIIKKGKFKSKSIKKRLQNR